MQLLNGGSLTTGAKEGELAASIIGLLLLIGLGSAGLTAGARDHSRENLDAWSSFACLEVGEKKNKAVLDADTLRWYLNFVKPLLPLPRGSTILVNLIGVMPPFH